MKKLLLFFLLLASPALAQNCWISDGGADPVYICDDLEVDGEVYGSHLLVSDNALLDTPVAGAIEYADCRMYITNVNTQRAVDRTSDVVLSTTTVTNTTTETTVFTGPIPANSGMVGNKIYVEVFGDITNAAVKMII